MDKEKKIKKVKKAEEPSGEENFLLKKIRYYQGTIKDYDTYWNEKIAEGEREESPETKSFAKRNAELNKAFEIVPVEKDETVIGKDVVSGKDKDETPKENPDAKPSAAEEGDQKVDHKEKHEEKHEEEEEVKVKDEKKEEKGEEEEEVKEKDEKKEEKGDDDGDEKKKKKDKE